MSFTFDRVSTSRLTNNVLELTVGKRAYVGDLTSLKMVGNCRARASPAEMIALRNIGGPLNRFIIMTDICTSMGKSELYSQMVGVVQLEHTG